MNPHAGKAKLLPELAATTRAAREAVAEAAFNLDAVRGAIMVAAKEGFTSCAVGPKKPLNLKDTAAAHALLRWLGEAGLQHQWEQRLGIDQRSGGETTFDLLVSWRL